MNQDEKTTEMHKEWEVEKNIEESREQEQWLYGGVVQPQEQKPAEQDEQLIVQFPTVEEEVQQQEFQPQMVQPQPTYQSQMVQQQPQPQMMQAQPTYHPQQQVQPQPIQAQPVYQQQVCPQRVQQQSQSMYQPQLQQPLQSQPMYQQQTQMMQPQPTYHPQQWMPQQPAQPQPQMMQQLMYQSPPRQVVKKKAPPINHSVLALISMILGIASLLLFACGVNYSLLIGAIIVGIIHLAKRGKPAMAIVGIVTAVLSFLLSTLMWIAVVRVQLVDVFNNSNPNDGYYDYFDDNFGPDFEDMEGGNQML